MRGRAQGDKLHVMGEQLRPVDMQPLAREQRSRTEPEMDSLRRGLLPNPSAFTVF